MTTFKNKKKIIIIALSLFMALTVVMGLLFTGSNNVAKADDYTPYFAIEDGISIKLNEDGGMRFIAKMDTTIGQSLINGEKTMQFIIAPTTIFDYADSNSMEYINLSKKIVVDVDKDKVYPDNANEPTCYYANGCVTKMYESNFNLTYEAVGYIVGERYTERNSNATGTYYEKVNATFLNQNVEQQILGLERYSSWYGTEKYPINIKNQEQYNRVVEKCNAGNTAFNGKNIVCESGVQWDDNDFTNQSAKPELSKIATILTNEISTWTGNKLIGSALNSSDVSYKLGEYNVYETNGGYGQSIVNTSILASNYSELHFAFKTDAQVTLSNGDYQTNVITPNTWYFVKLKKQVDGNWTISAKAFGDNNYTLLTASEEFFGAGRATFETMFRTYLWTSETYNHTVYATDVWGVTVVDSEISAWEKEGLIDTGFNALSNGTSAGTLGNLNISMLSNNTGYDNISNANIDSRMFDKLYFAYKTDKWVNLSNTDGNNVNTANTWYFVKLERQEDGGWTISVKEFGESNYKTLIASDAHFGAGNATFASMFRTYRWDGVVYNVYATNVWGVTVVDGEISAWESAGAVKLGSALNSSEPLTETLGGLAVYKTKGGWNKSIVNTLIDASAYSELHFAYKVNQDGATLSSGDKNAITKDTWYFVKLKKQDEGSWKIFAKVVGESAYTELTADQQFFGVGNATFDSMFRTFLWGDGVSTYNHEVYATDVWGVTVVDSEVSAWESAGAVKLGSALNSSEAIDETLGGLKVYKTNGGFNYSIANTSIEASIYSTLYFAYKTDKDVNLSNTDSQNLNKKNTWYFVKLEKQADGSWTISAKVVGDSAYTALVASANNFGAGNATFDSMFKTNLWEGDITNNHTVYATDVWGK